ncbi:MAG: PHB depolymerase family esterase [Phycisphaerae bacterium]
MRFPIVLCACVGCVLAAAGCMPAPPIPVTRQDLAASYLEFETSYFGDPPAPADIARLNRAFDGASVQFFTGDNAGAVRALDELTATRTARTAAATRVATSLKLVFEPPVYRQGAAPPVVRVAGLYLLDALAVAPTPLRLRLRGADDAVAFEQSFVARARPFGYFDVTFQLAESARALGAGWYRVELATADDTTIPVRRLAIVARSLDEIRMQNEALLAELNPATPALRDAFSICKARNALLSDRPSEDNSTQFLSDPLALSNEVARELADLRDGRLPYRRRAGDYWRVVPIEGAVIPMRVYVPAAAAGEERRPLLIALHGAGGDENMFFEGYGAGAIRKLADELDFIVAAPLTYLMIGNPAALDRVVGTLRADYAIDDDRVYLLGHSLGVVAAAGFARNRPETIAAVATFAGTLTYSGAATVPPTLALVGALDPLSSPERARGAAESAAAAGLPVEFRLIENYGHTLVVGDRLREAVEWLLARRLPYSTDERAPPAPAGSAR